MVSLRAGPRWDVALGQRDEISVAFHAGGTTAAGRLGIAWISAPRSSID